MLKLKGFDTVKVGEKIELPDTSELILFPFVMQADLEDLYKNASSSLRSILDKIELKNDKKYASVNMTTQLLSPNVTAAPRGNWHFDTDSLREDNQAYIHLLLSDCTALTEFTKDDFILDNFQDDSSPSDVEIYLNKNEHLLDPIKITPNSFHTFEGGRHIHRAINSELFEFRFMIRVLESDSVVSKKYKDSLLNKSQVFNDNIKDYSKIDIEYILKNKTNTFDSIVKHLDRVDIFYN